MSDQVPAPETQDSATRGEGAGTFIGRYRLLQQVGEGGFGAVFEAEQTHPVKRRVALKLIKLGMDTHEVMARFEAERQALAMMDHPHIARVLDAGATESGRPYFVMELVKGEPISNYCDRHNLSVTQRLKLFDQVCTAVQHAHTKGVIHRDIKPSNVLVSTLEDEPYAKVIDFGVAKATNSRLTDMTLFTAQFQMIGTPVYMSPEQAEGSADIDTRSDIYSLGVLLYKLLTDTTPFETASQRYAGKADFKKLICEVDTPRPSSCLSQSSAAISEIATLRGTEPRKLTQTVRGELDWIVMKAIEKERKRRYETANALAMDVRRYLAGQPVLAAPPSATYRLKKFVRRNKVGVAMASAIVIALVVGILSFARQANIARARADELEQVSKFQADMLGQVDPSEAGKLLTDDVRAKFAAALAKAGVPEAEQSAQISAFAAQWQRVNAKDTASDLIDQTILKPAVAAIDTQFKDQPIVAARLRRELADRYVDLGLYDAATPLLQQALAVRRRELGEEHPLTLESIGDMGFLLREQGELGQAEPYFREALEKLRRVRGDEHPETLDAIANLGSLLKDQGKLSEAEKLLREVLEKRRRILGEDNLDTLDSITLMGLLLQSQGKLSEAEPYYREALTKRRQVLGEEHVNTLQAVGNMGFLLEAEGKFDEAEPYDRDALEKQRRVSGEEHPLTLIAMNNLGHLLQERGKLSEAEPYLREALEKSRRILGDDHLVTLSVVYNLGVLLQAQGKLGEAEADLREALESRRRVLGEEHQRTLVSINAMGSLLDAESKYVQAAALLAPAETATRKAFTGANAYHLATFLVNFGKARAGQGEYAAAEANLLEAREILVKSPGPFPEDTRESLQALIDLYAAWHTAEPGHGYDAKAAEWRQRLGTLHAPATPPTAAQPASTRK